MIDALKRASAGLDHRLHPLLRLRAPGSQDQAAHADLRAAGRRSADRGGRRPGAVDRSARRADPGLLQHPRRSSVRAAGADGRPARRASATTRSSCRPTRAASSGRAPTRSGSARASPSSTSGAPRPTSARSSTSSATCKGRDAIIVDDMVDTAGTLCAAAQAIKAQGARAVYACASHGVLSPPALDRIMASPLEELIITDTIAVRPEVRGLPEDQGLERGAPARRGGQTHSPRRLDQLAVHLNASENEKEPSWISQRSTSRSGPAPARAARARCAPRGKVPGVLYGRKQEPDHGDVRREGAADLARQGEAAEHRAHAHGRVRQARPKR